MGEVGQGWRESEGERERVIECGGWKGGEGGRFVGEEAVGRAGRGGGRGQGREGGSPSLSPLAPALGRGKRAEGGGVGGGLVEKGRKKSGI